MSFFSPTQLSLTGLGDLAEVRSGIVSGLEGVVGAHNRLIVNHVNYTVPRAGVSLVVSGSNPTPHRIMFASIIQLLALCRQADRRARDEHRRRSFPFPTPDPVLYPTFLIDSTTLGPPVPSPILRLPGGVCCQAATAGKDSSRYSTVRS